MEIHRLEDILDLIQGLAPEILGLQHLGVGLLDQFTDVADVGGLKAIGGAHREFELAYLAVEIRIVASRLGFFRRRLFLVPASSKLMKTWT